MGPRKNRKEPLRFDSFRFRTFRKLIGLVQFGSGNSYFRFDAVRPALVGRVVARSGSVRFGSAGSVRFLIPSYNIKRSGLANKNKWAPPQTPLAAADGAGSPSNPNRPWPRRPRRARRIRTLKRQRVKSSKIEASPQEI